MAQASSPPPLVTAERLVTALLVLDDDLRVTWMNDAMADLLGVGVRRMTGQPFAGLLPEGAHMLDTAVQHLRGGDASVRWRRVRLTGLDHDEHRVDMAMQMLDPAHWLLEVHPLAAPVVDSRPLSATLRGVAHEVKNPLTGLRGAAQLLAQRASDADTRQLAGMMIEEVDRLAELADRLLSLGPGVRPAPLSVYPLLDRVRTLCAGRVIDIEEDYDPSLPDVYGVADRLQQLLLNLANNAIEAGADHLRLRTRVAHGVALSAGTVRTAVRIDVIDDGPGVPGHLRDHLFEPMVSGRDQGTGLGLALALETARDHGGDLRHARSSEGTVFSLYLPLHRNEGGAP
ncbi:MAG TPA: ATP-binding protein [Oleiagrimonas sp.]|nr:ATP-binding protein [Oleiagrimonas sp.]